MRYPAIISHEGDQTLAVFHFDDGTECATSAEPGESIEALAEDALTGRLTTYLEDEEPPPRPPARVPHGQVLWVTVAPRIGVKLALRWARADRQMSQKQLGDALGWKQQQVARLESPGSNPTLASISAAAKVLEFSVDLVPVDRSQLTQKVGSSLKRNVLADKKGLAGWKAKATKKRPGKSPRAPRTRQA